MAVFGGGLLSFEVIGLDRVLAGLASVQDAVKDLRPFWKDIFAPKYFATVQDVFALQGQGRGAGGRFAGGRWAPLSPAYAAWKRRHFPGRTILVRTGRLRESVNWNGTGLGAGGIFEAEPGFAIAGTAGIWLTIPLRCAAAITEGSPIVRLTRTVAAFAESVSARRRVTWPA